MVVCVQNAFNVNEKFEPNRQHYSAEEIFPAAEKGRLNFVKGRIAFLHMLFSQARMLFFTYENTNTSFPRQLY